MRSLLMNPQEHEVELGLEDNEGGAARAFIKLGEVKGRWSCTWQEAKRVGEWFIKASQEIKKAEKIPSKED